MASIKFPISSDQFRRLSELKNKTGKTKRVIFREALEEYLVKNEKAEEKQQKLELH